MKKVKIYVVAAISIIAFGIVYAQYATPTYTSHYKLRMYTQGQTPGADSLNKNTRVIDSLLYQLSLGGGGGADTSLLLHKFTGSVNMARLRDSVFKISNLDTTRFAETWNTLTTSFDTGKVFFRRDTVGYFNRYNFDTSAIVFQNQRDSIYKRVVFNDSLRGRGNVLFDSMKVLGTINTLVLNASGSVIGANFVGDGSLLTSLNAEELTNEIDNARLNSAIPKDSAALFGTDTSTTQIVRAKTDFRDSVTFRNVVKFLLTCAFDNTVTFLVSPVFLSTVNFANGLTTTTITASGNVNLQGFTKLGDLAENEKVKFIRMYIDTVGGYNKADHGFTGNGYMNINTVFIMVKHDTTAGFRMLPGGSNSAAAITPGVNITFDSLKIWYFPASTATGLLGDTAIFKITYGNIF